MHIAQTGEGLRIWLDARSPEQAHRFNLYVHTAKGNGPGNGENLMPGRWLNPELTSWALAGAAKFALPEALQRGETMPLLNPDISVSDVRKVFMLAKIGADRINDDPA